MKLVEAIRRVRELSDPKTWREGDHAAFVFDNAVVVVALKRGRHLSYEVMAIGDTSRIAGPVEDLFE